MGIETLQPIWRNPGKSVEEKIAKMRNGGFDAVEPRRHRRPKEKTFRTQSIHENQVTPLLRLDERRPCFGRQSKARATAEKTEADPHVRGRARNDRRDLRARLNGQPSSPTRSIRAFAGYPPAIGEHAVKVGSRCAGPLRSQGGVLPPPGGRRGLDLPRLQ